MENKMIPIEMQNCADQGTNVESGEDEKKERSGSYVECDSVEDKAKSKDESPPEAKTKDEIVKLGDPSSPLIDSGEDKSSLETNEEFESEEDGAIDGKDGVSVEAISSSFPLLHCIAKWGVEMSRRFHVGRKVVDNVDLFRKRHWSWRLDVWPFAIIYATWLVTIPPNLDIGVAAIVLGGLVALDILVFLFTVWSVDFRCLSNILRYAAY
ncbi:hypothetical protein U1Q18_010791 [Sarracenia purpurea var. burkii]